MAAYYFAALWLVDIQPPCDRLERRSRADNTFDNFQHGEPSKIFGENRAAQSEAGGRNACFWGNNERDVIYWGMFARSFVHFLVLCYSTGISVSLLAQLSVKLLFVSVLKKAPQFAPQYHSGSLPNVNFPFAGNHIDLQVCRSVLFFCIFVCLCTR